MDRLPPSALARLARRRPPGPLALFCLSSWRNCIRQNRWSPSYSPRNSTDSTTKSTPATLFTRLALGWPSGRRPLRPEATLSDQLDPRDTSAHSGEQAHKHHGQFAKWTQVMVRTFPPRRTRSTSGPSSSGPPARYNLSSHCREQGRAAYREAVTSECTRVLPRTPAVQAAAAAV